jgi:two-component system, LytTR family, response regulator
METSNIQLKYLIVEDAIDVCKGIQLRMQDFREWKSIEESLEITDAIAKIKEHHPQLLFMDWNIKGGSTYELLKIINDEPNYKPYIVYFTGFQNDEPEIPQEVFSLYKVDKYFIKPIWEKLSEQLPQIIVEAIAKNLQSVPHVFQLFKGGNMQINLIDISLIIIGDNMQRTKIFYMANGTNFTTKISFDEIDKLFEKANINAFAPNKRESRVLHGAIIRFENPYIYFTTESIKKVQVSMENVKSFMDWWSK